MTITINTTELNNTVKAITTASVDDYADTIHGVANAIGIAVAFILATASTVRAAYRAPLSTLDAWTQPAPQAVAAPVKERPTKSVPKPRPAPPASSVIVEKPVTAKTSRRVTRSRKKVSLATV